MDYDTDTAFPFEAARARPLLAPRNDYSIGEGLDAKVVVMGNSAVGKTSLVQRFTENKFKPASTMSTTGAFFVTKKVIVDGLKVRLQLWDTAGQERFRSMAPMYYRGANAAILCYDITDASTFDDIRIWLDELKQYQKPGSAQTDDDEPPLLIYIVGTKADLGQKKRAISHEQARRSLHTWFPPPPRRAPSPPPPPPSKLSTITTASGLSYIRPRFTSLTSSLSVPAAAPPRISALTPSSHPPTAKVGLSRAQSARVVPVGTRLNPDGGSAWNAPRPGVRERRWSDAMMWDEAMREREEEENAAYPAGATTDNTSDAGDDDEDEWPLEKGMELFEVSAKDGQGVDELFDHLLASIINRRDAIKRERMLRERNSVMLDDSTPESMSSDNIAAKRPPTKSGWSCCAS